MGWDSIHALVDKVNRTVDPELRAVLNAELAREVQDSSAYSFVAKAALEDLQ